MNSYRQFLSEKYQWYDPKKYTTIKEIEDRYYSSGDKANDRFRTKSGEYYTIMAKTKEIDRYKEYNWSKIKFRRKDFDPGYWDELTADIKKNGIKYPLVIILYEHEPEKAHVGEGNHRLGIAKEIGIREIPVRFLFYKGRRKPEKNEDDDLDDMLDQIKKEDDQQEINDLLKRILGEI
jgi:hypothetical protein